MRRLLTLEVGAGTINVLPTSGKVYRIVGLWAGITGPVQGEQILIEFRRGLDALCIIASEAMSGNETAVRCAVGMSNTLPLELSTDPVTGIVTYDTTVTELGITLPDIVWDCELTMIVAGNIGAVTTAGTLLYEELDA